MRLRYVLATSAKEAGILGGEYVGRTASHGSRPLGVGGLRAMGDAAWLGVMPECGTGGDGSGDWAAVVKGVRSRA